MARAAAPYMRDAAKREMEGGGAPSDRCIINVSSTSGLHGNVGQANYAAAKVAALRGTGAGPVRAGHGSRPALQAGIVGLTKTIAKEWGAFGVRANAVPAALPSRSLACARRRARVRGGSVGRLWDDRDADDERFCLRGGRGLARPCRPGAVRDASATRPQAVEVGGQAVQQGLPPEVAKMWEGGPLLRAMVPLNRKGRPEEAAGGILFLASPHASYVTGHTLEVTGGMGI